MINNRQGGRRRGRGGQRTQGQGQGQGGQPGNRQDNRQRGNAAQLLEKYKSMARDSQLAGDRVQTEYYLQFADHYFRVLGESRSRFEDQRSQRGDDDDDDGEDELGEADGPEAHDDRPARPPARDRTRHSESDDQPRRRSESDDQPSRRSQSDNQPSRRDEADDQPRRRDESDDQPRRRAERPAEDDADNNRDERPVRRRRSNGDGERLPLSALPPAIGRSDDDAGDGLVEAVKEESPKPRRRARSVKAEDGDDDVAPSA